MGLIEKREGRIFLNVKSEGIERYNSQTQEKKTYGAVKGLPIEIKIVEKEDYDKVSKYQELQLELYDDDSSEYYILCSRLYKPFSDGLIFAMANPELNLQKPLTIAPYTSKKQQTAGMKASIFCSVKSEGKAIKWVEGYPEVKVETIKKTIIKDREDRDKFVDSKIAEISEKIKGNRELSEAKSHPESEEQMVDDSTNETKLL